MVIFSLQIEEFSFGNKYLLSSGNVSYEYMPEWILVQKSDWVKFQSNLLIIGWYIHKGFKSFFAFDQNFDCLKEFSMISMLWYRWSVFTVMLCTQFWVTSLMIKIQKQFDMMRQVLMDKTARNWRYKHVSGTCFWHYQMKILSYRIPGNPRVVKMDAALSLSIINLGIQDICIEKLWFLFSEFRKICCHSI